MTEKGPSSLLYEGLCIEFDKLTLHLIEIKTKLDILLQKLDPPVQNPSQVENQAQKEESK